MSFFEVFNLKRFEVLEIMNKLIWHISKCLLTVEVFNHYYYHHILSYFNSWLSQIMEKASIIHQKQWTVKLRFGAYGRSFYSCQEINTEQKDTASREKEKNSIMNYRKNSRNLRHTSVWAHYDNMVRNELPTSASLSSKNIFAWQFVQVQLILCSFPLYDHFHLWFLMWYTQK